MHVGRGRPDDGQDRHRAVAGLDLPRIPLRIEPDRQCCRVNDGCRLGLPRGLGEQILGQQVIKRHGQLAAGHVLVVDPDGGEQGLVEESPLGRVGSTVGDLDAVGQGQGLVEHGEYRFAIAFQPGDGALGRSPLTTDALLFLLEQVFREPILVVGVEQFAFLTFEAGQFGGGSAQLRGAGLLADGAIFAHGGGDALAPDRAQHDRGVVLLDGGLDGSHAVMGLAALARLAATTPTGRRHCHAQQ